MLVDGSASMDFGTAEHEKRELAVAAVAAVGFLTAGHGNRLGALRRRRRTALRRYPARTGRSTCSALLAGAAGPCRASRTAGDGRRISAPRSGRWPGCAARRGLRRGRFRLPRRRTRRTAWEQPLRRLAARHQVLAVEVLDPRELELPDVGLLTLVDPETGRRREVATSPPAAGALRRGGRRAARRPPRPRIRRAGAAHLRLRTDRDWVRDLVRHVHAQRRLAQAAAHVPRPEEGRHDFESPGRLWLLLAVARWPSLYV